MWKPMPCCCSSVTKSCPALCDPMNCQLTRLPIFLHLLEFVQTHVHWVGNAIQPSHPLLSLSPPVFNLPQHQGLFQWVSSLHQVAKEDLALPMNIEGWYTLGLTGWVSLQSVLRIRWPKDWSFSFRISPSNEY